VGAWSWVWQGWKKKKKRNCCCAWFSKKKRSIVVLTFFSWRPCRPHGVLMLHNTSHAPARLSWAFSCTVNCVSERQLEVYTNWGHSTACWGCSEGGHSICAGSRAGAPGLLADLGPGRSTYSENVLLGGKRGVKVERGGNRTYAVWRANRKLERKE
jgi:hypothetical protein